MINKLFILLVASLFVLNLFAQEQHPENCPFGGREDCTGYCGNFTDENGDGFCDYAILTKQTKKETKDTVKNNTKQKLNTIIEKNASKKVENKAEKEKSIVVNVQTNSSEIVSQTPTEMVENELVESATETATIKPMKRRHMRFHFWEIFIATIVLYTFTAVLSNKKVIKKLTHRKIWNCLLLITCLVSCLIGVFIVLAHMYDWKYDHMTLMTLHVDFGLAMTIIAIIHILWHTKYWKNLFKGANK